MSDTSRSATRRSLLNVECLEDRTVPTFLPRTGANIIAPALINNNPFPPVGQGGLSIAVGDVIPETNPAAASGEYIVATGPGVVGTVSVFDTNGRQIYQWVPFAGFTGGLNVAFGDVMGDGASEVIVTPAANGLPVVGIFTPSGQLLNAFLVNGNTTFLGGLNVVVGNVQGGIGNGGFFGGGNSQFKAEIIVGAASVLPAVLVLDAAGNTLQSFFAFDPSLPIGVTVAASSIDTTRTAGSGQGGGGGFGGRGGRVPDTNSYAEIIVGAASFLPAVSVWSVGQGSPSMLQLYLAFDITDPANQTGVTVAAGSTDGIRGAEIYVALTNGSRIRAFNGASGALIADFTAFPPGYSRVVNMAVGNVLNFNATDDSSGNFGPNGNLSFLTQDLVVVAGDGPFNQRPRVFLGRVGSAAGLNGP